MSERRRYEKDEKEEKREEKEEKERQEKNWEEKYRRDPLGAVVWAGVLIWAGLVLMADNFGLLARFERLEAWALIFIGAGVIVLLEAAVRVLAPAYRRPVTGTLVLGLVLIAIGMGNLLTWNVVWPLVLIILGGALLFRTLIRRG